MERRLLLALPAGLLITGAIFLGLDFALRLPESNSRSIYRDLSDRTQSVREPKRSAQSDTFSGASREPVHPRDIPEPPPVTVPFEPPGDLADLSDVIAWQMVEPLPVKTDKNTWRSGQCGKAEQGGPGRVDFEFVVGSDGRTKDARVLEATSPELAECAMEAARNWRWQPAVKDGELVESGGVRRIILFAELNQPTDR